MGYKDNPFLGVRPRFLVDVRVQMVVVPFPTLLSRAAMQVEYLLHFLCHDSPLLYAILFDQLQDGVVLLLIGRSSVTFSFHALRSAIANNFKNTYESSGHTHRKKTVQIVSR
jgi:hypothetical protein